MTGYRPVPWPRPDAARAAPDYGRVEVRGVATDGRQVYVFQYSAAHPLLVFTPDGRYVGSWGGGLFTMPHGCRVEPHTGNLWLTDDGDHRVLVFTPGGRLIATYGVRGVAGNDSRHFNRPADVAFAPDGSVYVADGYGNARVVHLSAAGKFIGAWGRHGTGRGEFHLVHSVAVGRDGRVYVADRENARLQVFSASGTYLTEWRQAGHPFGLDWTPSGDLVICDGVADTVSVYNTSGKRQTRWGGTGSAPGKFRRAHLLSVEQATGAIYVTEVKGRRVQKFTPETK